VRTSLVVSSIDTFTFPLIFAITGVIPILGRFDQLAVTHFFKWYLQIHLFMIFTDACNKRQR